MNCSNRFASAALHCLLIDTGQIPKHGVERLPNVKHSELSAIHSGDRTRYLEYAFGLGRKVHHSHHTTERLSSGFGRRHDRTMGESDNASGRRAYEISRSGRARVCAHDDEIRVPLVGCFRDYKGSKSTLNVNRHVPAASLLNLQMSPPACLIQELVKALRACHVR
jgi:hypothetical protein